MFQSFLLAIAVLKLHASLSLYPSKELPHLSDSLCQKPPASVLNHLQGLCIHTISLNETRATCLTSSSIELCLWHGFQFTLTQREAWILVLLVRLVCAGYSYLASSCCSAWCCTEGIDLPIYSGFEEPLLSIDELLLLFSTLHLFVLSGGFF